VAGDDPKTDEEKAIGVNGIGHHVLILLHGQPNPNLLPLIKNLQRNQNLQ